MLTDVKNLLTEIKTNTTIVQAWGNMYFKKWQTYFSNMQRYLSGIADDVHTIVSDYFPPSSHFVQSSQWFHFWDTFREKSFDVVLKDTLLEVQKEIDNQVNPLSDDNKEQFNANIDKLKSDTAYGSALELNDGVQTFYNNFASASPTASLDVKLLPVSFYSASIPAKTITIDFSWFAPYRDVTMSLWRFFLWVAYLFILFKRFPDIISGTGMITDTSTNGNMTDGSESILHSITVNDDGSIASDIESRTVRQGNTTNRVTVKHDVSGKSTDLRR